MYRIAISGHRGLPAPTVRLVDLALRAALGERAPEVTGLSCLADGADQIFARAVTDLGGTLEAVIPAAQYREKLPEDSHPGYDDLLARAAAVHRLPFTACRSPSPRSNPTWPPASSWWTKRTSCTRCGTASPRGPTAAPPTSSHTPASTAPPCA